MRIQLLMLPLLVSYLGSSLVADEALPRGVYQILGVEISPIDRTFEEGKTHDKRSKKLTHWVRFDIQTLSEKVKGREKEAFQLLDRPVASALSFNKPIRYRGHLIPADTNLIGYRIDAEKKAIPVRLPAPHPFAVSSVRFDKDFKFEPDDYVVKMVWKSPEGGLLEKEIEVRIELK